MLILTAGPEVGSSFMQGKMRSEFQGDGNNLVSESSRPISRPSSNYNNRSQQVIGLQKGIHLCNSKVYKIV